MYTSLLIVLNISLNWIYYIHLSNHITVHCVSVYYTLSNQFRVMKKTTGMQEINRGYA